MNPVALNVASCEVSRRTSGELHRTASLVLKIVTQIILIVVLDIIVVIYLVVTPSAEPLSYPQTVREVQNSLLLRPSFSFASMLARYYLFNHICTGRNINQRNPWSSITSSNLMIYMCKGSQQLWVYLCLNVINIWTSPKKSDWSWSLCRESRHIS